MAKFTAALLIIGTVAFAETPSAPNDNIIMI